MTQSTPDKILTLRTVVCRNATADDASRRVPAHRACPKVAMQPNKYKLLFSLLLLLLLAACAPSTGLKTEPATVDPRVAQAEMLEASGDYLSAAELLASLAAEQPTPERERLQLQAVTDYLQARETEQAANLLSGIDISGLSELAFQKRILEAEVALIRNHPDQVLSLLADPPTDDAAPDLRQRYHRTKAEAFRLTSNLLESGRELSELDLLLSDPQIRLENQLAIIQTYATLSDTALDLLQPIPPGIQGGWMQLARIIKSYGGDPAEIQPLLAQWREGFPSHPAMPELLEGYFENLKAQYRRLNRLAILLPADGRYAAAAAALRDGFLAAYYQQSPELRPDLTFYDSSNPADIWPLYQEAIAAGADMMVGPLSKEGVTQLIRAGELDIPVLALNQVQPDVAPPADLYQFGLSPEDEARQVAERAWIDGHLGAVVLTPNDSWGQRIFTAFSDRWEQLGGILAEHQTYDPKEFDFAEPITKLLNIDESNARRTEIQGLLGKRLEFEPRRRQDADFILLVAKAHKARQIRPQLQFHHAADLPVYATSHVFSGRLSSREDLDLEGIKFPDIPWLIVTEEDAPLSRDKLAEMLPQSSERYQRLYAMGIDSFRLLPNLARLQSNPKEMLEGKTGHLYLDRINQVQRQLVWAEMRDGVPQVLGYSPRMYSEQEVFQEAPAVEVTAPATQDEEYQEESLPQQNPAADGQGVE